jgi:tRNA(Ile)-lysidine synthase
VGAGERWELHLPGGIFVSGNRRELTISRAKPETPSRRPYRYKLPVPGEVKIPEVGKSLRASIAEAARTDEPPHVAFVDQAALDKDLVVRSRGDGDRLTPLGMRGTKKLQDLFVDEKIPLEDRDSIPVIESGGNIVWVAGLRLDDRAKVTGETRKVVKLELL